MSEKILMFNLDLGIVFTFFTQPYCSRSTFVANTFIKYKI